MPYITESAKDLLRSGEPPECAGDLNFLFTTIAVEYVREHGLSYQTINDVMGVFACAAQEFYRRVAADYEDLKVIANGDVYPLTFSRG